jgi:hypothetical protein
VWPGFSLWESFRASAHAPSHFHSLFPRRVFVFAGRVKQFVDEMVGYVLDFFDEVLMILIYNSLRNPPFTWIDELHPPYG